MTSTRGSWLTLLGVAAVCAAVMVVCVIAGLWQFGRYQDRSAAVEQFQYAVQLPDLELKGDVVLDSTTSWRTVTAAGEFDGDVTVLRNRPVDGSPAVHYLAWLDTDYGWMLVNLGASTPEAQPPIVPSGPVTVSVMWREWEEDDNRRGDGATRITPQQVPERPEALDGYGMLADDCSVLCSSDMGLRSAPVPQLTTGPHLAYAWQWWGFGAFAPVGAVLLLRRERSDDAVPGPSRRRRTTMSDEDVEDALWDDEESG